MLVTHLMVPSATALAVDSFEDLRFFQGLIEVKYQKANKYWDVSGELIEAIEQRIAGLKCEKLEENGFRFSGTSAGITAAQFYWDKVILIQSASDPASKFLETAAEFFRLTSAALGISKLERAGHRLWFYVPASREQATARLKTVKLWTPNQHFAVWGEPLAEGSVLKTEYADPRRTIRAELSVGELRGPNIPTASGILVDIDFGFSEPPDAGNFDLREFARWNSKFAKQHLAELFS
jgi:hypothetical protein